MQVAIFGPNLFNSGTSESMHVHRPGCADTNKKLYVLCAERSPMIVNVGSLKELTHWIYPPGDFEYDPDTGWRDFSGEIKVFGCLNLPDEDTPSRWGVWHAETEKLLATAATYGEAEDDLSRLAEDGWNVDELAIRCEEVS